MYGGMTYENANIQDAIDKTFIAQQDKVNAAAFLAAQNDKNAQIELAANAEAEKARREGQGQADAKLSLARAEADGIALVAKATQAAASNTALIEMRRLEVERIKAERWNGQLPIYNLGSAPSAFMNISAVAPLAATATAEVNK
jgi:hypothetical protein